jgi:hypothetical protein
MHHNFTHNSLIHCQLFYSQRHIDVAVFPYFLEVYYQSDGFFAISTLSFTIRPSNVADSCFPRQNTSSDVFLFSESSKLFSEIAVPGKDDEVNMSPRNSKSKRFKD